MEIVYKPEAISHKPPNTIIFKNKWYDQSALFSSNINTNTDFIIKDKSKILLIYLILMTFIKK